MLKLKHNILLLLVITGSSSLVQSMNYTEMAKGLATKAIEYATKYGNQAKSYGTELISKVTASDYYKNLPESVKKSVTKKNVTIAASILAGCVIAKKGYNYLKGNNKASAVIKEAVAKAASVSSASAAPATSVAPVSSATLAASSSASVEVVKKQSPSPSIEKPEVSKATVLTPSCDKVASAMPKGSMVTSVSNSIVSEPKANIEYFNHSNCCGKNECFNYPSEVLMPDCYGSEIPCGFLEAIDNQNFNGAFIPKAIPASCTATATAVVVPAAQAKLTHVGALKADWEAKTKTDATAKIQATDATLAATIKIDKMPIVIIPDTKKAAVAEATPLKAKFQHNSTVDQINAFNIKKMKEIAQEKNKKLLISAKDRAAQFNKMQKDYFLNRSISKNQFEKISKETDAQFKAKSLQPKAAIAPVVPARVLTQPQPISKVNAEDNRTELPPVHKTNIKRQIALGIPVATLKQVQFASLEKQYKIDWELLVNEVKGIKRS